MYHGISGLHFRRAFWAAVAVALCCGPALAGGDKPVPSPSGPPKPLPQSSYPPSFILQPVPPKTVPASTYPAGTQIIGQEIILGSVPARVWLEIQFTGWAPDTLKNWQAKISATDEEMDGGGYSGASAMCMGGPSLGAANLFPALQPCTTSLDCRGTMSGLVAACALGEPSRCLPRPPSYPPGGNICEPGFQDRCDLQWCLSGIPGVAAVDRSTSNFRYGAVTEPPELMPDFHPTYGGTLVIDIPADAKGKYTIDFKEDETFLQSGTCTGLHCEVPNLIQHAFITVPCGRCCFGVGTQNANCVDHVSANECATYTESAVFEANEVCPQAGGPPCPLCALDDHCDDDVECTRDECIAGGCTSIAESFACDDGVFCNGVEVCDAQLDCLPGPPPCNEHQDCIEADDFCQSAIIPTTSTWGLAVLGLLLLIAAKLRFRRLVGAPLLSGLVAATLCTSALGGGPTPTISLQPVQPKTFPPSDYPPGTTIMGRTITLGSVPARVWLEIHLTDWAPYNLRTFQAKISATDEELDGGGYSGTNAYCMGSPVLEAADLVPALQSCTTNTDCRASMSGLSAACALGEPSQCIARPAYYPPGGDVCEPGFQDKCDPRWVLLGIPGHADVDLAVLDFRYGATTETPEETKDYHPTYGGTLVIDVPADAKGTYSIDFKEDETFLQYPIYPPGPEIPLPLFRARITVSCGRCCYGVGSNNTQCVDHVSANECAQYAESAVFEPNEICPQGGGPPCPLCALGEHCDDGVGCTRDECNGGACVSVAENIACDDGLFCNGAEICDAQLDCLPGQPPCTEHQDCIESDAFCQSAIIPTTSTWGLAALTLLLLVAAKLRFAEKITSRAAFILVLGQGATYLHAQDRNTAGWGCASIILRPVPPKTVPASSYPPDTVIVAREIILGSVPARVWIEVHFTGWAPDQAKTVQGKISATDKDMDGGGYLAETASCQGTPPLAAGDLFPAIQPCTSNNDCRSTMSGIAAACAFGEPSRCIPRPPFYPPGGTICEPGFQDKCDTEWALTGVPGVSSVDYATINFRFGATTEPPGVFTDFHPTYLGTLVIDVPGDAKGTYTIDFKDDESFLQNPNSPPDDGCPPSLFPAVITIPCGRCCYGVSTEITGCVDHVSANECANYAESAVFEANEVCPEAGGPPCPQCALDEHCDDGVFCNGAEYCDSNGECTAGPPACTPDEICHEEQSRCAPQIPAVSEWGLLVLALALLVTAKVGYRRDIRERLS